jgi:hypothetical protein
MQFQEYPPPQGLSEARRGRAVSANVLTATNPPREHLLGGGGFITNNFVV